jgi:ankyrin repeat protein
MHPKLKVFFDTVTFNNAKENQGERQRALDAELLRLARSTWRLEETSKKIEEILNQGASVDARDEKGCTPLHLAARANQSEAIKILVAHGADIESRSKDERTPLLDAAHGCAPQALDTLLEAGANTDVRDTSNYRTVYYAVIKAMTWNMPMQDKLPERKLECLRALLRHGIEPDKNERRSIWMEHQELAVAIPGMADLRKFTDAGIHGDWGTVEAMIASGMHPDAPAEFCAMTPLFTAVAKNDLPMIDKLLKAGADANGRAGCWTVFDYYANILQVALYYRHPEAASRLMDEGADPKQEILNGELRRIPLCNFIGKEMSDFLDAEVGRRGLNKALPVGKPLQFRTRSLSAN